MDNGILVKLAVGDAKGAGYEYAAKPVYANIDTGTYLPHPLYNTVPGSYTDDTQMSIANAEVILVSAENPTKLDFADAYVRVFKRDARRGYAKRFYALLDQVRSGQELLDTIIPNSERSGAAMRAPVIGLYPEIETVLRVAKLQASVTHDTVAGIEAAQAAALMAHYFRYRKGAKAGLRHWVVSHLGSKWAEPHVGEVDELGFSAVNAAITAIENGDALRSILVHSIAFQGDVDTVAAIAMGCAGLSPEIEDDLPKSLYDGLEDGPFGRTYLAGLSSRLAARFADQ